MRSYTIIYPLSLDCVKKKLLQIRNLWIRWMIWGLKSIKKIEVDGIQCVWFPLLDHGVPKIFHETKLSMVNHSISSFYSSVEVASNSTMLKTCLWPSFPCCHRLNFCHIPLSFVSGVCSPTRSFLVSVLWWWS